jgi:hypothetical protein
MKLNQIASLICLLFCASGSSASAQEPKDPLYRDQVTLNTGKVIEGRIFRRYDSEEVLIYRKSKRKKIKRKDLASMHTLRDDLEQFLLGHSPGMTIQEDWERVQEARDLNLPSMAIVQSWKVLTRDANHQGANEFIGHKAVRGEYRWNYKNKKKAYHPDELQELMRVWQRRFVLESPHYRVETNTSIAQAVNTIFDLELTYLYWMDQYGELLQAGEQTFNKNDRMTWYVYQNKQDKGFSLSLDRDREAYYNPAKANGPDAVLKMNLVHSYYGSAQQVRPQAFFDLAIRQLMFTTMVLSHSGLRIPEAAMIRPNWVELGMGHWLGRQLGGPAGHARHQRFVPDTETRVLAQRKLDSGALSKHHRGREVDDLLGLHRDYFEVTTTDNRHLVYRAKARSFFRFIMETDPEIPAKGNQVIHSRDVLIEFLRDTYPKELGPTSKALKKGMGGDFEVLHKPWVEWRK